MRQLTFTEFLAFLDILEAAAKSEQPSIDDINAELNSTAAEPITDFSWALQQLKQGNFLARKSWNGPNQHIALAAPKSSHFISVDNAYTKVITDKPYLLLYNGTSYQPGWVPSQGDLFATDWYLTD